jgi:hypothetical protein
VFYFPPAWGSGEGLTIPHCKKACYEMLHRALVWVLVNTVMNLHVP